MISCYSLLETLQLLPIVLGIKSSSLPWVTRAYMFWPPSLPLTSSSFTQASSLHSSYWPSSFSSSKSPVFPPRSICTCYKSSFCPNLPWFAFPPILVFFGQDRPPLESPASLTVLVTKSCHMVIISIITPWIYYVNLFLHLACISLQLEWEFCERGSRYCSHPQCPLQYFTYS